MHVGTGKQERISHTTLMWYHNTCSAVGNPSRPHTESELTTPPRLHPTTTHTVPPPAPVTHARVVHACGYRKTRVGHPHHTDVVPQHVLCRGPPSPPTHRVRTHHTPRLHPATTHAVPPPAPVTRSHAAHASVQRKQQARVSHGHHNTSSAVGEWATLPTNTQSPNSPHPTSPPRHDPRSAPTSPGHALPCSPCICAAETTSTGQAWAPQHVLCRGPPSPPTHRVQTHAHPHVSTPPRPTQCPIQTQSHMRV